MFDSGGLIDLFLIIGNGIASVDCSSAGSEEEGHCRSILFVLCVMPSSDRVSSPKSLLSQTTVMNTGSLPAGRI